MTLEDLTIPSWLECIIYTKEAINSYLDSNKFLFDNSISSIRSFGYLVSDRRYIFTLDPFMKPMEDNDIISSHIRNLITPSICNYFNTMYDPYQNRADFSKGFPYSHRNGVQTVISHGMTFAKSQFDMLTNLVCPVSSSSFVSLSIIYYV